MQRRSILVGTGAALSAVAGCVDDPVDDNEGSHIDSDDSNESSDSNQTNTTSESIDGNETDDQEPEQDNNTREMQEDSDDEPVQDDTTDETDVESQEAEQEDTTADQDQDQEPDNTTDETTEDDGNQEMQEDSNDPEQNETTDEAEAESQEADSQDTTDEQPDSDQGEENRRDPDETDRDTQNVTGTLRYRADESTERVNVISHSFNRGGGQGACTVRAQLENLKQETIEPTIEVELRDVDGALIASTDNSGDAPEIQFEDHTREVFKFSDCQGVAEYVISIVDLDIGEEIADPNAPAADEMTGEVEITGDVKGVLEVPSHSFDWGAGPGSAHCALEFTVENVTEDYSTSANAVAWPVYEDGSTGVPGETGLMLDPEETEDIRLDMEHCEDAVGYRIEIDGITNEVETGNSGNPPWSGAANVAGRRNR